jgi:hypothetical protein
MKQTAIFKNLEDAIKFAGHGTLYIYVAPNLHEGWLKSARIPQLRWYEKLIHVDRSSSSGFLQEIGADEDFPLIAIGQSFVLFTAHNETELLEQMNLTRPWVETFIRSDVNDGLINPATFRFPPAVDDADAK